MSRKIKQKYKGKSYDSLKSLCEDFNANYSLVHSRISNGCSIEEALQKNYNTIDIKYRTGINGEIFKSTKEMADYYNISRRDIKKKIDNGYSIKEIINEYRQNKDKINEKRLNKDITINEICVKHKITRSAYDYRLSLGWDMDKVLNTPMKKDKYEWKRINPVTNEKFESIEELCNSLKNGITPSIYKDRLNKGWTVEKALYTTPLNTNKKTIDLFGNTFNSFEDAFKFYKVNPIKGRNRLKNHSLSVALEIIPVISYGKKGYTRLPVYFRTNFIVTKYLYKGIDNKEYWSCKIDNQEMILSKDEIYQRMEAIVINEYEKEHGKIQTTES